MDLRTAVGSVALRAPVMTASGTAGHGAEFANYLDPASLGAVVVKSMKADEWAGNPAPRVHPTASGMINSVGLQGKGVPHWLEHDLPDLLATGATVVASIWGSSVDDYARAAAALAEAPEGVVAVEVNVSCPNLEDRGSMFAHSRTATAEVIEASTVVGRPMWAKLSPNAADLPEIAEAAHRAGAEARDDLDMQEPYGGEQQVGYNGGPGQLPDPAAGGGRLLWLAGRQVGYSLQGSQV